MRKVAAYAKLLRAPGISTLGIIPVIAALTMGISDINPRSLIFIIGAFSCIFGFVINDYVDLELDGLDDKLKKKTFSEWRGIKKGFHDLRNL